MTVANNFTEDFENFIFNIVAQIVGCQMNIKSYKSLTYFLNFIKLSVSKFLKPTV